jgi:precorrin-6Y C5,15-methyltransferase (decarboxylating)
VVIGSRRQLDLLPEQVTASRVLLPSPLREGLRSLVEEHAGRIVVLASGDPLHYGVGRALVEELGASAVHVLPAVSAMALACARMGWPVEDTEVVSLVGRPLAGLVRHLHDRAHVLVLSEGPDTPTQVAELLVDKGFRSSVVTVLEDLGTASERVTTLPRDGLTGPVSPLNILAIECRSDGSQPRLGLTPGLDDTAYETDGQLTKRHVRAAALSALAPSPGELLWDIGGGSGSIGIEWMRAHLRCRAISIEPNAGRAEQIGRNATRLGVPALQVVVGAAPAALEGLPTPDAVFVGGGITSPGLLDAAWARLRAGGRLVANAVTLESEALLLQGFHDHGGELTRLEVSQAGPIGGFLGWQPARPVTQWAVTRSAEDESRPTP